MYYVYVLKQKNDRYYYGYTSDLRKRVSEHVNGDVKTTRGQEPKLVYYETFKEKREALKREKFIKSGQGREQIKRRISERLDT